MQDNFEQLSKFYLRKKSTEPVKIIKSEDQDGNESDISICHPGVIEDLIKKSQEELFKKVQSQIKEITKNVEYNFEKMYKNINSKVTLQNQRIDEIYQALKDPANEFATHLSKINSQLKESHLRQHSTILSMK